MRVVKAWQSYITDHYYRQMKAVIRKYDPDRLILGDRYCQFYYPNVVQTASPYVDAISTNFTSFFREPVHDFVRFHFAKRLRVQNFNRHATLGIKLLLALDLEHLLVVGRDPDRSARVMLDFAR